MLSLHSFLPPPLTALLVGRSLFAGFAARTSVMLALSRLPRPPLTTLLAGRSFFAGFAARTMVRLSLTARLVGLPPVKTFPTGRCFLFELAITSSLRPCLRCRAYVHAACQISPESRARSWLRRFAGIWFDLAQWRKHERRVDGEAVVSERSQPLASKTGHAVSA